MAGRATIARRISMIALMPHVLVERHASTASVASVVSVLLERLVCCAIWMTRVSRIHAMRMPFVRRIPSTVRSPVRAPKDIKDQIALRTLMNAIKDHRVNTMVFVWTFPAHLRATAVKASRVLVVRQTSTSASRILVRTRAVVSTIPALSDAFACQVN